MSLLRNEGVVGRAFFGIAVAASGALQLVTGRFVRLVPTSAQAGDAVTVWPYLVGIVLLVSGGAIVAGRMVRPASLVVAGAILASLLLRQVPRLLENPWAGFMWTNPLKGLALAGGALLLVAMSRPPGGPSWLPGPSAIGHAGTVCLAVFLAVCGVQHFVYADFVTTLVPSWCPAPRFWTYFTGVALIAGGLGLLVSRTRYLAALLSAAMIFLWVLLLHIPRGIAGPDHASETAGVFEALAISGIALMVAAARRSQS